MDRVAMNNLVSESTVKPEPLPTSTIQASSEKRSLDVEGEWLEGMKSSSSDPEVLFAVGQYNFEQKKYGLAMEYFEKAGGLKLKRMSNGKSHSSQAKYQLGVMYYDGLGVKENPVKGTKLMLEVAQSREKKDTHLLPSAQYNLGRAYFMGFGVTQSDEEAEAWWCSAASFGNDPSSIRAKHTLGLFYSRPETYKVKESFKWHMEAAEGGNLESMAAVGVMHIQGKGCERDDAEGLKWLKKSAKEGCIYGGGLLSRQYYSLKLFSKAAETAFSISEYEHPSTGRARKANYSQLDCIGVATACFVLARCLQLGLAVSKNEPKAMELYEKAKIFDKKTVAEMHDELTHNQL